LFRLFESEIVIAEQDPALDECRRDLNGLLVEVLNFSFFVER
jgi:hypothetical protein